MDAQTAAGIRDFLLSKLEHEHKSSLRVIEHLPENELGYTPHEKLRPFGELAHHMYAAGLFFTGIMKEGGMPASGGDAPKIPGTKKDLLQACDVLNRDAVANAMSLSGGDLVKPIPLGNFGTFPALNYLDMHVSHIIHHRAQLAVYLREMGAKVPATYGDSADYPLNL